MPSLLTNPGGVPKYKIYPAVLFTYIWGPPEYYTILLKKILLTRYEKQLHEKKIYLVEYVCGRGR